LRAHDTGAAESLVRSAARGPIGERRRRLAVVVPGVPHPSCGASVVLFYQYLRAIRDAGYEALNALVMQGTGADEGAVDFYRREIRADSTFSVRTHTVEPVFSACRFTVEHRTRDLGPLRKEIEEFAPDAVVAFDLVCASVVSGVTGVRKIAWLGDLLFDSQWYNYLYTVREKPATLRWLPYALVQRCAWRRLYRRLLCDFDRVIVSSKSSERRLAALGLNSEYLPYPWPNKGVIDDDTPRTLADEPRFFFFGTLVALGSRSSLHFLLDRLYPRLIRCWGRGGFRIDIAGRERLPAWFGDRLRDTPEIRYLGFVDDLDRVLARCHAVLAPVSVPVGNRSRILTAMAKRVLVIAHANTALANPDLVDGETCWLAHTTDEFVQRMVSAVNDRERSRRIIDSAQAAYCRHFDPAVAAPAIVDVIEGRAPRVLGPVPTTASSKLPVASGAMREVE